MVSPRPSVRNPPREPWSGARVGIRLLVSRLLPTGPSSPSRARATSTKSASTVICSRASGMRCVGSESAANGCPARGPRAGRTAPAPPARRRGSGSALRDLRCLRTGWPPCPRPHGRPMELETCRMCGGDGRIGNALAGGGSSARCPSCQGTGPRRASIPSRSRGEVQLAGVGASEGARERPAPRHRDLDDLLSREASLASEEDKLQHEPPAPRQAMSHEERRD